MEITASQVKELRDQTGAGMMDAKKALVAADGDMAKAIESLRAKGALTAEKKADRVAGEGLIESYIHGNRIGAIVEINCETDFVARNPEFKAFAHDVAMQVASMNAMTVDELYEQPFIKDAGLTIRDLRNNLVQKIGENIQIKRFTRFELGGE